MRASFAATAVLVAGAMPLALPARSLGQQPAQTSVRRIVVTAFDPFGGREINNSARIAEELRKSQDLPPGVEITVCILPVVYDQGAAAANACIDALPEPPEIVVSLGEAGCSLQLETAAHNQDDTPGFPDNAGNIHEDRTIIEGAPASIGFDLPVQDLYCALSPEERSQVMVSESPGGFVCNNTAFHLANRFRGTSTRFSFVHVPASGCPEARVDPAANARTLARMFGNLLERERTERPVTYALPHCTNTERLPVSLEELARAADSIGEAAEQSECEREFLERLKTRL